MKEYLEQLNQEAGITGSMVITPDGIMVSAALGPNLEEDRMAAVVSSLLVTVCRCLQQVRAPGRLLSCSLDTEESKIVFFDMENSFLVVVLDPEVNLDSTTEPIQEAIRNIKSRTMACKDS